MTLIFWVYPLRARVLGGIRLNAAVGIECGESSITCSIYVDANLFAYKRLIVKINLHLQRHQPLFQASRPNTSFQQLQR